MTRNKVTLGFISKDSERKASFKKRKRGLMKKAHELSTLFGIEACVVVYSDFEPEPEVYPSQPDARRILTRFMELPDMDRSRLTDNLRSFTRQRIEKAKNKLRRLQRDNKRKQLTIFMFQCIEGKANLKDFDAWDAGEMNLVINEFLRDVTERMDRLKAAGLDRVDGHAPAAPAAMTTTTATEATSSAAPAVEAGQQTAAEEMTPLTAAEFSYLGMLMSPIDDGTGDFGWKNETMMLPPSMNDPTATSPSAPPPGLAMPAAPDRLLNQIHDFPYF